jgi:hypothetical protein
MRFLLLGGSGQVGTEFQSLPVPRDVEVVAPDETAPRAANLVLSTFARFDQQQGRVTKNSARRRCPTVVVRSDIDNSARVEAPLTEMTTSSVLQLSEVNRHKIALHARAMNGFTYKTPTDVRRPARQLRPFAAKLAQAASASSQAAEPTLQPIPR